MTQEELNKILENHKHWLKQDCDGWEKMRADLRRADLRGADLRGANLREADLRKANLWEANLRGADLWGANLRGANLRETDLKGANLMKVDLREASLRGADLWGANLRGANLRGANLWGADLGGADLRGANLREADLRKANLWEAKNVSFIPLACPSDGAFIGWKKVDDYLIKLQIPEDAKRSSATTSKCRCDKAKVLGIYNLDGTKAKITSVKNCRYEECEYIVGEMVYPDSFDEDRWNECSHGIHFFINRQEAIDYAN